MLWPSPPALHASPTTVPGHRHAQRDPGGGQARRGGLEEPGCVGAVRGGLPGGWLAGQAPAWHGWWLAGWLERGRASVAGLAAELAAAPCPCPRPRPPTPQCRRPRPRLPAADRRAAAHPQAAAVRPVRAARPDTADPGWAPAAPVGGARAASGGPPAGGTAAEPAAARALPRPPAVCFTSCRPRTPVPTPSLVTRRLAARQLPADAGGAGGGAPGLRGGPQPQRLCRRHLRLGPARRRALHLCPRRARRAAMCGGSDGMR